MSQIEQSEVQSPAQREGIMAVLACGLCCAYLFGIASPTVQLLPARWAEMLVYTLLPLTLTFTLLYGSRIHREMARVARAAFLFMVSVLIFTGVAIFMGTLVVLAGAFTELGRGQPGH
jgi:hypothetical protein